MGDLPNNMVCLIKKEEKEGYDLDTLPVPSPVSDQLLIKITKVGICGSDIALYKWNAMAKVIAALPFTPGHEAVGVVVSKGPDADRLKVGDRVAVENHFFCGKCFQCKASRGDICQFMNQYGHGKGTEHGGCSQYSIVPERRGSRYKTAVARNTGPNTARGLSGYCYKLQRDISDLQAVLLEPMGVAHNAIERLEVNGEVVVVIGCGPVGLFAVACAKALGATKVWAVDVIPSRLELAKKMGADVTINASEGGSESVKREVLQLTDGVGVGRICEASGAAMMLNGCFSYLRKGGRVSLLGLPKQPLHVENVLQDIIFKSLTLTTVHGRRIFHTWEECERLMADGIVDAPLVVSHDIPMSQHEDAFGALFGGNACKIIMNPQL